MSSLETYLCRHLHMQRKRSKPNPVPWVSQERFRDNKGNSIEQQGLFRFLCTLTSVIEPGGGPTGTRDGLRLPQWNLGFPAYVCASQLFPDNYGSGEGTGQLVRDQADV